MERASRSERQEYGTRSLIIRSLIPIFTIFPCQSRQGSPLCIIPNSKASLLHIDAVTSSSQVSTSSKHTVAMLYYSTSLRTLRYQENIKSDALLVSPRRQKLQI